MSKLEVNKVNEKRIPVWLETRHTLDCIDDDTLIEHSTEFFDIFGGLKGLLLAALQRPNSFKLEELAALNTCFNSIKEKQQNMHEDQQLQLQSEKQEEYLTLDRLPSDLLHYISLFLSIKQVNRLKNVCTFTGIVLTAEIRKINLYLKILDKPISVLDFVKSNNNVTWTQLRLPYHTTYRCIVDQIENLFGIPSEAQLIVDISDDQPYHVTEVLAVDFDRVLWDEEVWKDEEDYPFIALDARHVVIDSRKFNHIPIKNCNSELRFLTLTYVDLLSANNYDIDHILINDFEHTNEIKNSFELLQCIQNKICLREQSKIPNRIYNRNNLLCQKEFAEYLLDQIASIESGRQFIFSNSNILCLKETSWECQLCLTVIPRIKSVLMNNISIFKYRNGTDDCGKESFTIDEAFRRERGKLTVVDVELSGCVIRYIIIKVQNQFDRRSDTIDVFERVSDSQMPTIHPDTEWRWEPRPSVGYIKWEGINLIVNNGNKHIISFNTVSEIQTNAIIQSFQSVFH